MVPLGEFRCGPSLGGHVPHASVPDINDIIIRAAREAVAVWPPRQSADVARVAVQHADLVLGDAHIVVPDAPVLAAAAQDVAVPAERRHARLVVAHRPQPLVRLDVPQLDVAVAEPDRDVRAVAGPVERAHVRPLRRVGEVRDRPRLRVPHVRLLREPDGEGVARRPREQIEVVVVDHQGRVEDAFWLRGEASLPWTARVGAPACAAGCGLFARVQRLDIDPLRVEGRVLRGRWRLVEGEDACGGVDAHSFGESLDMRGRIFLRATDRARRERRRFWIGLHNESVRLGGLSERGRGQPIVY